MKITTLEKKQFLYINIGIVILVLAITFLAWKYTIVSGGMPGYALALNYLYEIPIGLFLFAVNSVVILANLLILGKSTGVKAIYGYITLSLLLEFTKSSLGIERVELDNLLAQILLIAVQGFIAPIGIALVLLNGYSFGSWTSLYPLIQRIYRKLAAPAFFLIMDLTLCIIVFLTFGLEKSALLILNAVIFYFSFKYFMGKGKKYLLAK
jgi:uncharacterized membrane-anchored protein YitT (DUF2179 family)